MPAVAAARSRAASAAAVAPSGRDGRGSISLGGATKGGRQEGRPRSRDRRRVTLEELLKKLALPVPDPVAASGHLRDAKPGEQPPGALQRRLRQAPRDEGAVVRRAHEPDRAPRLRAARRHASHGKVGAREAVDVSRPPPGCANEPAEIEAPRVPQVGVQGDAAALRQAAQENAVACAAQPGNLFPEPPNDWTTTG